MEEVKGEEEGVAGGRREWRGWRRVREGRREWKGCRRWREGGREEGEGGVYRNEVSISHCVLCFLFLVLFHLARICSELNDFSLSRLSPAQDENVHYSYLLSLFWCSRHSNMASLS